MEFFDKLGKKASEAYKATADKTGKLAKEAKLRMKIGELKSEINNIYEDIGKIFYENHAKEQKQDISGVLEEKCVKIDCMSDEIKSLLKECLELKDRRQCLNCFAEIDKNTKFCPECGAKQEINEENVVEAEVVDEEKSNLEKTVEVESDVDENHDETVEHLEEED